MGRKSTIHKLEPDVRSYIENLLRADRLTLDEMIAELQEKFPRTETAAKIMVEEFGEDAGGEIGGLLAQAVTILATRTALKAHEKDDVSIAEIAELSRAARAAMQARTMSLKERLEIEKTAREKLIREQKAKLDELGKTGDVPAEMLAKVIKAAYDL